MNEYTPLTMNQIYVWIGSVIVGGGFLVGSLLFKDWVATLIADRRAKRNGGNGRTAVASNGDVKALIAAQNNTKDAVVNGFADLTKTLTTGFGSIKSDTDATRKIVEVTDDDLAHRVHNKPAVEKLIRKIWTKVSGGVADG